MTNQTFLQSLMKQAAAELPGIAAAAAALGQPDGGSPKTGPTNTVKNAANGCHPAETAVNSIVQTHVEHSPTRPARKPKRSYKKRKVDVTQWQTSTCEYCEDEMTVKRATGPKRKRFCSVRCRVAAHREKKEAGGGRAGVFLMLAALVVVIWYFWPFLMDVAAQRPRLPDQAPAAVPAVPQIIIIPDPGQAPTAVPIIWPTMAPAPAPTAEPLPTAVPASAEPLPTMAPTAVPTMAPAAENPIQEGQGGQTYTLTNGVQISEQEAQFLKDCARGQAHGRRVSPRCPARAADLLPGVGR